MARFLYGTMGVRTAIVDRSKSIAVMAGLFANLLVFGCNDDDQNLELGLDTTVMESEHSSDSAATMDATTTEVVTENPPPACSGDEKLVFAAKIGLGSMPLPGTEIEFEVGKRYLYISGDCHYWAVPFPPTEFDDMTETRHGVFSEEQWSQLARSLYYTDWPELQGSWSTMDGHHLTPFIWTNGTHKIKCLGNCDRAIGAPPEVVDMFMHTFSTYDMAETWIDELWQQGSPLHEDLRVKANLYYGEDSPKPSFVEAEAIPWELDWPLDEIWSKVEDFGKFGKARRISEKHELSYLRGIVENYRKGTIPEDKINTLVEKGCLVFRCPFDGGIYQLWMRDELPFADEHGLVPQSAFALQMHDLP